MAKREWGNKHTCMGCGAKYYDLNRRPIKCPNCGTVVEVATARPNRRRPPAQPESPPPKAPPANDDVIEDIDGGDDDLVEGIDKREPTQAES